MTTTDRYYKEYRDAMLEQRRRQQARELAPRMAREAREKFNECLRRWEENDTDEKKIAHRDQYLDQMAGEGRNL